MAKKNIKKELGEIIGAMTDLEVKMAQTAHYENGANRSTLIKWVNDYSSLSSRLDKIWKSLK